MLVGPVAFYKQIDRVIMTKFLPENNWKTAAEIIVVILIKIAASNTVLSFILLFCLAGRVMSEQNYKKLTFTNIATREACET